MLGEKRGVLCVEGGRSAGMLYKFDTKYLVVVRNIGIIYIANRYLPTVINDR